MSWYSPAQVDFPYQMHRSDLAPDRKKEEEDMCSGFAAAHILSLLSGPCARSDLCEMLGILFREDVSPSVPSSVRTSATEGLNRGLYVLRVVV